MNTEQIIEQVNNGYMTALDAYILLDTQKKQLEEAISSVKEDAVEEARKLGTDNGTVTYRDVKLQKVASRASYSYSHIPTWIDRKSELQNVEELAKLAAKYGKPQADPDTGEFIPPAIVTYSKEGLSVKAL